MNGTAGAHPLLIILFSEALDLTIVKELKTSTHKTDFEKKPQNNKKKKKVQSDEQSLKST